MSPTDRRISPITMIPGSTLVLHYKLDVNVEYGDDKVDLVKTIMDHALNLALDFTEAITYQPDMSVAPDIIQE